MVNNSKRLDTARVVNCESVYHCGSTVQLRHFETINGSTFIKNRVRLDTARVVNCETVALCNWDTVGLTTFLL